MSTSEISKLKVTVRHLLDAWPRVLERRYYLRRMAQSEALRAALRDTYAGHVFNAIHGAMSFDLVRAVGALILDRNSNTASLRRVVAALRKPTVIVQLRKQVYGKPGAMSLNGLGRGVFEKAEHHHFDAVFASLPAQLNEIEAATLKAPLAATIEGIRHKSVAHAAVEHDGVDWRMWAVGNTRLTYGQLDEYIDACTDAVDKMIHLVLRTSFNFDTLPGVDELYADEYIDALVTGLQHQKRVKERRRAENLRRMRALLKRGPAGV